MTQSPKLGILVTNLGTPDAPTPLAVKNYLAEFLWDPYVVQIPRPIWWIILHGVVLRIRPQKSARLYQKIWTTEGSPLLVNSQKIAHAIEKSLRVQGYDYPVVLGMRYGNPSIHEALTSLREQQVEQLMVLPLYPQYSIPTTASTSNTILQQLGQMAWRPSQHFINDYHQDDAYIAAVATSITNHWQQKSKSQLLLFSYHGLPEKYVSKQGDPYYDQCLITSELIAKQLQLSKSDWRMVFQSRFGAEAWLKPYCSEVLQTLPQEGITTVDIVCPGFAADCLETLEEIAITNKKLFLDAGGKQYDYIPALNDESYHVKALTGLLISLFPLSHEVDG